MFASLKSINMFHKVLLSDLEKRTEEWTEATCIADIFLDFLHYLKVFKYLEEERKRRDLFLSPFFDFFFP